MAQARPYYADRSLSVAFYDVVAEADAEIAGDIDTYAGLCTPGGRLLELGAGGGRLTFELARRGHEIVGVDISPAMLAKAKAGLADLPAEVAARIALRQGDMTTVRAGGIFDLVLCPYFTLAHVPAGAAWKNTFRTAATHLAEGGLAAFHLPRLEVMSRPGPANPDLPVFDHAVEGGGRLLLYIRERGFREAQGRLEQVIEYVELDPRGQVVRRSPERLIYYMADPTPLAATAGLVPDRDPIAQGSVGDIWVFRKGG